VLPNYLFVYSSYATIVGRNIQYLDPHFVSKVVTVNKIKQIRRLSDNPGSQIEQSRVLRLIENDDMRDVNRPVRRISRVDAESICSNLNSFIT
jgi:hypothetical protein